MRAITCLIDLCDELERELRFARTLLGQVDQVEMEIEMEIEAERSTENADTTHASIS